MTEHCCEMLQEAVDGEAILNQPKLQMRGRLLNEIDSDYAVRSPEDRPTAARFPAPSGTRKRKSDRRLPRCRSS